LTLVVTRAGHGIWWQLPIFVIADGRSAEIGIGWPGLAREWLLPKLGSQMAEVKNREPKGSG